ncbi:hypothetical protein AB1Y20_019450 [Prymnesium parvum]|uniref:GYF domain-containing protein n=1 Tax=Prymnesium parvum TaxID=97485 RepID=A0AB34JV32_PRYPA
MLPDFFWADGTHTQQGPTSAYELRRLYAEGQIGDRTYVFSSDGAMIGWQLIPQVLPLYTFCNTPLDELDALGMASSTHTNDRRSSADVPPKSPRTPRITAMARKLPPRTPEDQLLWREAADERREQAALSSTLLLDSHER